jgi:prepilin-type N-terminal cleavage/methylation domain-containing protein
MNTTPISSSSSRKREAFTLIELLTVIAIIGVLSAILIPVVGNVRNSSNKTKSLANLRQIYVAADLYKNDNKGRILGGEIKKTWDDGSESKAFWNEALLPYLGLDEDTPDTFRMAEKMMACPGITEDDSSYWIWGYGINIKPGLPEVDEQNLDYTNQDGSTPSWTHKFLQVKITEPSSRMFFCASSEWQVTTSMKFPAFDRFGDDTCPVVFFDGHTAALTYDELENAILTPGAYTTEADDS